MEKKENQKKVNKPYFCTPRAPRSVLSKHGVGVLPKNDYFIEDGIQKAKPGKGIDLIPYLKASQAGTDLACIIARLKAGDETVINVRSDGMTGDFVGQPHSVNDINDLRKKLRGTYASLSKEVKDLFKSEQEFYEACLDGSLKEKLSSIKKSEVKPVVKPVDKVENVPDEKVE